MFFDLSVPYLETLKSAPSKNKALHLHRLKTLARAMELGYTGVAFDRPFQGVMSDADRCRIPLVSLPSVLEVAPNLPSSAAFHRDRNGVPRSLPFRQYTRITVTVDRLSVDTAFNAKGLLRSYDLVAAKPLDQVAFDKACQLSDMSAKVDIITLDFPLKFRLKLPMVKSAIKRGLHFEIKYTSLIADVHIRRQMLSDARLLVDWTCGKNLIISSSALSANEIRGPCDVANLSSFLLGLSKERAKAAISGNCSSLIANALRKKDYKEAIRIERISSNEQLNSGGVWFSDWKDWDPISSGEGDLPPLDDISKLFSAINEQIKPSPIDILSCTTKEFSRKDHIRDSGENMLLLSENVTDIPSQEPGSGGTSSENAIISEDMTDIYIGEKSDACIEDAKTSGRNTVLDHAVSLSEKSDVCTGDDKTSHGGSALLVASDAPMLVTDLVGNISSVADGHLSCFVTAKLVTRSSEKAIQEDQTKDGAAQSGRDEILSGNSLLQMDPVEFALNEDLQTVASLHAGQPVDGVSSEMRGQEQEVDSPEEEVLIEDQDQQEFSAADESAFARLKSGKRKRKRSYPAHPLPFRGLLKPMLFKNKLCQTRRLS